MATDDLTHFGTEEPRGFLDRTCTYEPPYNPWTSSPGQCRADADYLVLDGDIPVITCARHLLDTIEEVVATSSLTVDSPPLGVVRLRETEND